MDFDLNKALEILEQTPITLGTFLGELSEEWIYAHEGGKTWSTFDIIGHLIHGEKTDWIPRLMIILDESDEKTFDTFDRFAQFESSKHKTLSQLLKEFADLRAQNLNHLIALDLTEEKLESRGIHPELGEVTLKQLLSCWVTHDLGHMAQICRVMAKQYKEQVGPWTAYLPILNA